MKPYYELDVTEEMNWLRNYFNGLKSMEFSERPSDNDIRYDMAVFIEGALKKAFELGIECGKNSSNRP
jgi:hypothetical protein